MYKNITENIIAVGVADSDLRYFENQYPLTSGVTYNSYVVCGGGKTAVIDSVDARATAQWLDHLQAACPRGVDYLVVQHMEPDHSASIGDFLARYPQAVIVASAQALKILSQFYPGHDFGGKTITVGEGSELEIGSEKLSFFTAPMIHWPEVIFSYHAASRTLFSADAFGTFGTDVQDSWPSEARRYYTNIVGKYGPQVQKALEKANAIAEGVERLCPLHGPYLEGENACRAIELYQLWSKYEPELPQGVLIAYASIYGNTAKAALSCAARLEEKGVQVKAIDLCRRDVSYAVAQAFRMGRILCAAPTYDAGVFPAMHDFLYHLQIKGLRNRRFALIENGSWAPAAAKVMAEMIAALPGSEIVEGTVTLRSAADARTSERLKNLVENLLK